METIKVGAYRIYVGFGILENLNTFMEDNLKNEMHRDENVLVVTDRNVAQHYLKPVAGTLKKAGLRVGHLVLPAGETTKSQKQLFRLLTGMVKRGLTRDSTVVALGGGVVGDLAGFAASVYMRGCRLVQIPTTLLAQADSSIGGKTGINLPQGKNLIGSFYNPLFVLSDLSVLKTLSERELVAGFAEVIKYGLIFHSPLFEKIERIVSRTPGETMAQTLLSDHTLLEEMLSRSIKIKVEIVRADERENDLRMILNFGHTFGHALEQLTGYTRFLHGEALLLGMEMATRLSVKKGMLETAEGKRIREFLSSFIWKSGGMVKKSRVLRGLTAKNIYRTLGVDKKKRGGAIHFILLDKIGCAVVEQDVPKRMVINSIAETLDRLKTEPS